MLPGDRKRRKTTSLVLGPLLSSSTSRSSAMREDIPYTHTHSYNPQSHLVLQPGHPGVFAGPGRDAGEKSTGSTQGRNQPWETHGQGEEEESEESPCKNPEVGHFLAESTRACGRLLARDPTSSLTDARVPRAQLHPRGSSAILRAQDDASSPPEAALGFFVYIRARWQTALARLSQAGH